MIMGAGFTAPHGNKEIVTNKGMWSCRGRWLPDMAKT